MANFRRNYSFRSAFLRRAHIRNHVHCIAPPPAQKNRDTLPILPYPSLATQSEDFNTYSSNKVFLADPMPNPKTPRAPFGGRNPKTRPKIQKCVTSAIRGLYFTPSAAMPADLVVAAYNMGSSPRTRLNPIEAQNSAGTSSRTLVITRRISATLSS